MTTDGRDEKASAELTELARELTSDPGYITGRRAFPRSVSRGQAMQLAAKVEQQIDVGAGQRLEAARRAKVAIACKAGCNACCQELVMVYQPEALLVASWLLEPRNADARAAFIADYPAWKAAVGDGAQRLADAHAANDSAASLEAHLAQRAKKVLCAFNVAGLCSIYEVRPILCRNAHATETADRCAAESEVAPTQLAWKPLDEFVLRARGLMRSGHHAIGGPRQRLAALCDAVHDLLMAATAV